MPYPSCSILIWKNSNYNLPEEKEKSEYEEYKSGTHSDSCPYEVIDPLYKPRVGLRIGHQEVSQS